MISRRADWELEESPGFCGQVPCQGAAALGAVWYADHMRQEGAQAPAEAEEGKEGTQQNEGRGAQEFHEQRRDLGGGCRSFPMCPHLPLPQLACCEGGIPEAILKYE